MHQVNADLLGWWLCERQLQSGGLNGRPEKVCMQTKVGKQSDPHLSNERTAENAAHDGFHTRIGIYVLIWMSLKIIFKQTSNLSLITSSQIFSTD